MKAFFLYVFCFVFLLAGFVVAQGNLGVPTPYPSQPQKLFAFPPNPLYNGLSAVDFVGDLTGDGLSEVIVAVGGTSYLVDMSTSSILNTFSFGNLAVGLGDIDGDSMGDFALGDPIYNSINIYSGATRQVINTISDPTPNSPLDIFPYDLTSLQDLNGDGRDELLVSDISSGALPLGTSNQVVYALDALNGAVLRIFYPPISIFGGFSLYGFGSSVADIGDINFDSVSDVAVSGFTPVAGQSPHISVFSGATGVFLYSITGLAGSSLGLSPRSLSSVLDFNSDSILDFAVGDYGTNVINVYSGINGALISTINPPVSSNLFGNSVVGGVLNGDLSGEVVSGSSSPPYYAFSGLGSSILHSWNGYTGLSAAVFNIGDFDGDGIHELLAGLSNSPINSLMTLVIEKLGGVKSYGTGSISLSWTPVVGMASSGTISLSGANPSETVYFFFSTSPVSIPIALPSSTDFLLLNPATFVQVPSNPIVLNADSSGQISVPGISIQDSSLVGSKFYLQGFVVRSGIIYSTNALELTFVP